MAAEWNPETASKCRRRQVVPGIEPRFRGRRYSSVVMTPTELRRAVPVPLWNQRTFGLLGAQIYTVHKTLRQIKK